ncbi:MBL fold metallo-hydrolase [Sphingomonas corticis]|jgi:L-ascorbate metabolism protein UlaG (beta-lactamase superfamily)|uniref:MBL fold metallo-hydrolase n=1 Tax=Sphingomonas corticis TaxID=2722791 RepID=A0ABX1CQI4_9SPHN|nr:MBL fold metallo-hydrolase [Sphingomonas corticis]NJR79091.1 MBL fold metallo-hydrolase [Sphingomonas corticis]
MATNRYYQGPPSDHFDGTRFFNPGQASTDRGLAALLRWKLAGAAARWPRSVPVVPARPDARVEGLRVTMIGHASLLIQAAGVNVLTDPVFSDRASPFARVGPRRVTAPGIAFDHLPPIDAVLLSHAHYDHMDVATLRRLHARDAPLMAMPLGNDAVVRAAVPGARAVAGNWWERIALGEGIATTLTPACHWSNRWPSDTRMMLWSGHWLDTPAGAVWFVGDTGYGDGRIFADVRQRLGSPRAALIPIGAYEPRWFMAAQHVNPAEAVRIFDDVGAGRALGIHWGTFQLTDEARDAPREALAAALAKRGIAAERFVAAEAGGVYDW